MLDLLCILGLLICITAARRYTRITRSGIWRAPCSRSQTGVGSRAINQKIGNVVVGSNSSVSVGIFGILGGEEQKRRQCQKWLAPWLFPDFPHSQSLMLWQHKDTHEEGSGTWLTEDWLPAWLDTLDKHQWFYGGVGCGKSVLSSCLINALRNASENRRFLLAFGYFAFNIGYSHSPDFLLRTVLAWLCSLDPVPEEILREYNKKMTTLFSEIELLLRHVLCSLDAQLEQRSSNAPKYLLIVLDGLDELPTAAARRRALHHVDWLAKINNDLTHFKIRFILFSRNDHQIEHVVQDATSWGHHEIQRRHIFRDIQYVMEQRIARHEKMSTFSADDIRTLATQITGKARGMFRLASMYLDEMEKANVSSCARLRNKLNCLPTSLYATYDVIVTKIEDSDLRQDLLQALRFVLFAVEPPYIEEVADACATLPYGTTGPLFDQSLRVPTTDIMQHLCGLLAVRPPIDDWSSPISLGVHRAYLAHRSVAEYLDAVDHSRWRVESDYFRARTAQVAMTQMCFAYAADCRAFDLGQIDKPLLRYIERHWSCHAAASIERQGFEEPREPLRHRWSSGFSEKTTRTRESALALRLYNMVNHPQIYSLQVSRTKQLRKTLIEVITSISKISTRDACNLLNDGLIASHRPACCMSDLRTSVSTHLDYETLNIDTVIRLCLLQPATDAADEVRLDLIPDSLDNQPEYSALSYTWQSSNREDDEKGPHSIIVGQGHRALVQHNLYSALSHLRHPTEARLIWADAISINQLDTRERNAQVSLIPRIYGGAQETLSWLERWDNISARVPLPDLPINDANFMSDGDSKSIFLRIMSASTWNRAFIMQELALSRDIVLKYDTKTIPWDFLVQQRCRLKEEEAELIDYRVIEALRRFDRIATLRDKDVTQTFPELIRLCWDCQAADPRDRIHSLLPLLSKSERERLDIRPDYTLSAENLCQKLEAYFARVYPQERPGLVRDYLALQ